MRSARDPNEQMVAPGRAGVRAGWQEPQKTLAGLQRTAAKAPGSRSSSNARRGPVGELALLALLRYPLGTVASVG